MNSRAFRKADIDGRRQLLQTEILSQAGLDPAILERSLEFSSQDPQVLAFADSMVENAFGVMPIPLGLAPGFLIDGRNVDLPLASEEPSVIAAASFMAAQLGRHGGIQTWADPPLMTASIYLEHFRPDAMARIQAAEGDLLATLKPLLASMTLRGGGFRRLGLEYLDDQQFIRVDLHIDVRDAMGANLLNSCAEAVAPSLASLSGGRVLLAILSNQAAARLAGASFSYPVTELSRGNWQGLELAKRIVGASRIAQLDPGRAVTHNKGIMNGISALALASGNDTRGIEAAAHAWAGRDGRYKGLSTYQIIDEHLVGRLEMPLPFGTVGGATSVHPVAQLAKAIMGNPGASQLSRYAAALGLAQNFAALSALCGEGIQSGHMKLHARRLGSE